MSETTRDDVERLLNRSLSDREWLDLSEMLPAPALCIDCRRIEFVAVTSGWLEGQGWEIWRGGARCPVCALRRCA